MNEVIKRDPFSEAEGKVNRSNDYDDASLSGENIGI